ncbi:Inner membrane protein YbhN [Sulfitobacter sp. THAF37]|nr:Inner membrane protein YbhN [Sulfitobacter sp. THAF37]
MALGCLWLVWRQLGDTPWRALPAGLRDIGAAELSLALVCVALSFAAVGRYDALFHRHFDTGLSPRRARYSGTVAIALSQTLGFGVLTGALARQRLLPQLGALGALRLSACVAGSFLLAWGWITALACLALPAPGWTTLPALAVLTGLPVIAGFAAFGPRLTLPTLMRWLPGVPSLPATGAILLWAALDLAAAGMVLYLMLPQDAVALTAFLPVFLLAYGAGLLSGAPGGVGPFELMLLGLLPDVPQGDLVAAVMGYRALYYALPAVLGALALLHPPACREERRAVPTDPPMPGAELGLLRQNGGQVAALAGGPAALWPTPQALVVLPGGAPLTGAALNDLRRRARGGNRIATLYKCTASEAARARAAGWQVMRIAREALLNPQTFDLDSPARRGLRRKLRQAAKAGVQVQRAEVLPLSEMAALDACWQRRNGRARGGTMGRFCPRYVAGQQVFLAWQGEQLVGFVTFHAGPHDMALDLTRLSAQAPQGTMQSLVAAALAQARAQGLSRLSLAAVPDFPALNHPLLAPLRGRVLDRAGAAGLIRFKSAFAPSWSPRYAAAPGRAGLALALADIAREVHHPYALRHGNLFHEQDEEYELAPRRAA